MSGSVGGPPLRRRERANIGLGRRVQPGVADHARRRGVFAFFVAFGFLAIHRRRSPPGPARPAHVLLSASGRRPIISEELLRVAGFLAAFTGMYFTVVLSTDSTYREEFAEDVAPQIRQALAVRAAYHAGTSRPG